VLFTGLGELWVTNGTTAGTHEIPLDGATSVGNLTVFNHVLSGADPVGYAPQLEGFRLGIARCCALAVKGEIIAAPPISVMNSRRLMSDMACPTRAAGFPALFSEGIEAGPGRSFASDDPADVGVVARLSPQVCCGVVRNCCLDVSAPRE
jgi:hypothetical protein